MKGGGRTTSYTCTIPAGRTMCVSKVINSIYLPASRYHYLESRTLGEPYVSSGYEMILSGAEATTKEGFWTASGWTFQVSEDSMNSNSVINKMLGFAGIDRLDPYLGDYHMPYGGGTDWYFKDFRCSFRSTGVPSEGACYEIMSAYGTNNYY